jgi:peptide subunit release factor 1 (eRF1)
MPEDKILTENELRDPKATRKMLNRELKRVRQMAPVARKTLVNCCGNLFISEKLNIVRLTVKCRVCGKEHEYTVEPQEVDVFSQSLVGKMCIVCYGSPVEKLKEKIAAIDKYIQSISKKEFKTSKFSDYVNVTKEDKTNEV